MHDITYANKIISLLKEKLSGQDRQKPIVVTVAMGAFSHVSQQSLRAAFSALSADEFKNVTINVETAPVRLKCKKCQVETKTSKPLFACPACGEPDFDITDGELFLIKAIEVGD